MKYILIVLLSFTAVTAFAANPPTTFNEVFTKVISQKCILCHTNPTNKPKKPVDFNTYEGVMVMVEAGNLTDSKLYQALLAGKMPPPKIITINPDMAIEPDDIALIEKWITDGALE